MALSIPKMGSLVQHTTRSSLDNAYRVIKFYGNSLG